MTTALEADPPADAVEGAPGLTAAVAGVIASAVSEAAASEGPASEGPASEGPASGGAASEDAGARAETAHATKGALLLAIAGASSGIGNLGFHVLVARGGGADTYGAVGALLTLGVIAGVLSVGTNYAIARVVARHDQLSPAVARICLRAVWPWIVISVAGLAAVIPAQHFLALSSPTPVAVAVALFAFIIVGGAPSGVLIGLGRFKAVAVLNVAGVLGRLVAGAALAGSSPLVGALVASMVPAAVLGLGSVLLVRRSQGSTAVWSTPVAGAPTEAKPAADAVAGAVLAASLWVVWSIPVFLARHTLGGDRSGGFTAAQLVASGILYLSLPLVTAFYPMVARGRRTDSFRFGMVCVGAIGALALPGLALVGPPLLAHVYGPKFVASPAVFVALAVSATVVALANFVVWMGRAVGRLVGASSVAAGLAVLFEVGLALGWHGSPVAVAAGPAAAIAVAVLLVAPAALPLERRRRGRARPIAAAPERPAAGRHRRPVRVEPALRRAVRRPDAARAVATATGVGALLGLGLVGTGANATRLAALAFTALVAAVWFGRSDLRRPPAPPPVGAGRRPPPLIPSAVRRVSAMAPPAAAGPAGPAPHSRLPAAMRRKGRAWWWVTGAAGIGAATIAQSWFRGGRAIASGDISPPYGTAWLGRLFQPWAWSGVNLGGPNAMERQLPWATVVATVHRLGGSEVLAQRLWLTALFAGAAVAAIALLRALGFKPAAALCGAAVYLLNARTVLLIPNDVYLAAFLLFPAVPAVIVATARRRIRFRTGVILMAAAAPLLGYTAENPPLALMVVALAVGAVALAAGVGGRATGRQALRCLAVGGGALIAASLYWLVPALVQSGGAATGTLSAQSSWIWTEGRANLANAFWLNNSWGWYFPQYFPFAHRYDTQPLAFLKYALPAVAFLALAPFARRSRLDPSPAAGARDRAADRWTPRRLAVPVAIPVLLIILLSTGTNFPGSLLFNPLYRLPFGWLLREPGRFLTVAALGYAILVAATIDQVRASLYRRAHSRRVARPRRWRPSWGATLATVALCAVTAGPGYPIVAGAAVPDHRPLLPPEHVTLPGYWQNMVRAIDAAPQSGAVAVLPPDDFYQVPYTWGYYGSDSFLPQMVRRPVVAPVPQGYLDSTGQLLDSVDQLATSLQDHDWASVHQALTTLSSPLLLVRLDIDRSSRLGAGIVSPDILAAAAAADPDLHLQHRAGALRLYALNQPIPPAEEVVRQVVTVDSPTPDLGTLSLLAAGTHLISGPPQAGLPVSIPIPEIADWRLQAGKLVVDIPEPPGWTYRVLTYPGSAPTPAAAHPVPSAVVSPGVTSTPLAANRVLLSLPAGDNLITDGDFADGRPWGPVGDCNNVLGPAAGVAQQVGPFGPGGSPALALSTRYDSACAQQRLAWKGGAIRLDLSVRHVAGPPPRLCVYELGPNQCAPAADVPDTATWTSYHSSVTPDPGTTGLILFLYSDGSGAAAAAKGVPVARNEYAQVSVSSAPPLRVAVFGDPQAPATSAPQLLLQREGFNGHWIGPTGSRHVLVDGLYNGWIGSSLGTAHPRYGPAPAIRGAAVLSGLTVLGLAGWGMSGPRGGHRRRRRRRSPAAASSRA